MRRTKKEGRKFLQNGISSPLLLGLGRWPADFGAAALSALACAASQPALHFSLRRILARAAPQGRAVPQAMPRRCFSQAQAERSVSSSERSAFHPSSVLA